MVQEVKQGRQFIMGTGTVLCKCDSHWEQTDVGPRGVRTVAGIAMCLPLGTDTLYCCIAGYVRKALQPGIRRAAHVAQ